MSNNNLQWNVETKYNLVTMYKNGTILSDVLNLANSIVTYFNLVLT